MMGIVESYASIAKRLGMSKAEAVKRMRNLEKMGFVTVNRRKGEPNIYFVHYFPERLGEAG